MTMNDAVYRDITMKIDQIESKSYECSGKTLGKTFLRQLGVVLVLNASTYFLLLYNYII